MTQKISIIRWLLAACLLAFLPGTSPAAEPKLNVLFIAADDLNHDLGCYGHPVVRSPNIDALAARGVRFDRAYCQFALCNPSRTSLLSGRRPEVTGIMNNETPPRTYLGDAVVFLPEHFKANGYFTARVGKIAHVPYESAVKWDVAENATGRGKANSSVPEWEKLEKDGQLGGGMVHFTATLNKDEDEPDGHTARRIVQLIEQNKDKPFFIAAGFHKPHEPLVAPKKYYDLYEPDKVVLPKEPPDERADIPPLSLKRNRADAKMTEARQRATMAAYYACVSFMDAQVGVVLDALDRLKLRESTIIVFFGDHGWHLGEHLGLWRKTTLFEEAAHAPLIIAAPGAAGNGQVCRRTVEFLGLYPTLVELCALSPASGLHGTSLVPLLKNPGGEWKPAFTVLRWGDDLGKSVRTERWRYSEWNGGKDGMELYDHEADPLEYTNLAFGDRAYNPDHNRVIAQMKQYRADEEKGLVMPKATADGKKGGKNRQKKKDVE